MRHSPALIFSYALTFLRPRRKKLLSHLIFITPAPPAFRRSIYTNAAPIYSQHIVDKHGKCMWTNCEVVTRGSSVHLYPTCIPKSSTANLGLKTHGYLSYSSNHNS